MVGALGALSRVDADTPFWLILAEHVVLMVSLATIFTPMFTLALGSLPQELYSHGSSILGTLQQVAGAVGTAVLVVILENRTRLADRVRQLARRGVHRRPAVGVRRRRDLRRRRHRAVGLPAEQGRSARVDALTDEAPSVTRVTRECRAAAAS